MRKNPNNLSIQLFYVYNIWIDESSFYSIGNGIQFSIEGLLKDFHILTPRSWMSVFRYFFLITFYILRFESESMIIVVIWKMVQNDTNYALPGRRGDTKRSANRWWSILCKYVTNTHLPITHTWDKIRTNHSFTKYADQIFFQKFLIIQFI